MSRNSRTPKKLSLLLLFSLLSSLVTMFFGGPFLRVLRKSYGPLIYWFFFSLILVLTLIAKTYLLLFILGSLWLAVGMSVELEKLKISFSWNILLSSLLGSVISILGYGYVLNEQGVNNLERFKDYFKETIDKMINSKSGAEIDMEALIFQIPSVVILLFLVSLVVSFLFERRVYFWMKLPKQVSSYKLNFLEYKTKEATIWTALVALLICVIDLKNFNFEMGTRGFEYFKIIQSLSSNLINIFVVVFFFQGFAVLEVFLKKIRASIFFRAFTYFIFIGQLFLVLSFIGFIDFWIDFRFRLEKTGWLKNESI